MGGANVEAIGIYLTVSGSADGYIMLMYNPKMAYGFVDLLMDQPEGTTQARKAQHWESWGTSWGRRSSMRWRMPRGSR